MSTLAEIEAAADQLRPEEEIFAICRVEAFTG
jgi:hypothetical protein